MLSPGKQGPVTDLGTGTLARVVVERVNAYSTAHDAISEFGALCWPLKGGDLVLVLGMHLSPQTLFFRGGIEACVLDGHSRVGWVFTDALERVS